MADNSIDIFKVLSKIDQHDVEFFSSMTEEQSKQLHPYVVQRWLTGGGNDLQHFLLNEYSNPYVFLLSHSHKLLAWYLILASCVPQKKRYNWIKTLGKSSVVKAPVSVKVIQQTFNYSAKDAMDALNVFDCDDVVNMAEMLGFQTDDIKAIIKEFKVK